MPHDATLIFTLAAGFGLAFVLGIIAARLRLAPVVGYLLAGVALGPFTPGYHADSALAQQLAELGVILLMFGVGLHFSIRDLLAVRRIALPGALAQMTVATLLGTLLARTWGWGWGASLVFGFSLSVASTVVLLRGLEARDALDSADGRIAVGWLVVEDIATVLALVLLPPLAPLLGGGTLVAGASAPSTEGIGMTVAVTLGKVAAFVILMVVVGRRVVPWLLERVAKLGSRELFTLAVLAVALGIAVGAAELFGVSFALGAFFAGVVINESELSHRAAADALPLQDAFAVLFFVSVGMLFDPTVLLRNPLALVGTLGVVVVGKFLTAYTAVRLLGYPGHTALTMGAADSQIGEFSFILAGLAIANGVLPAEARALLVAAALLSIALNAPLFVATGKLLARAAHRRMTPVTASYVIPVEALRTMPGTDAGVFASSHVTDETMVPVVSGHAVIIGYGRVGGTVGRALARARLPFVVVEEDERIVDRLRREQVPTVHGDATRAEVLARAGIDRAKLVVVTAPEPFRARRIVELARAANPLIDTAVRTHSATEQEYFEKYLAASDVEAPRGAGRAIYGERELALSLAHFALTQLGRSDDEADLLITSVRTAEPTTAG